MNLCNELLLPLSVWLLTPTIDLALNIVVQLVKCRIPCMWQLVTVYGTDDVKLDNIYSLLNIEWR